MKFFDSEIVENEMRTTTNLVELFNSRDLSESERNKTLQTCIDKLKIFYARLGFSEDDEATELKNELDNRVKQMGFSNLPQCLNWLQGLKYE